MTVVRTVLGDIAPADLGPTYAHEHIAIAASRIVEQEPDVRLDDVAKGLQELAVGYAAGLRTVVDAMPCDTGREILLLAALSRGSGVHVIAPTGLHLGRFYDERHWSLTYDDETMADLFVADIEDGIDAGDYGGPLVHRTPHRAGVVKVAGSRDSLSERDRKVFRAAAAAHLRTGCPILTHCTDGTAAIEQVRLLVEAGVDLGHVVLSHTDKIVDRGYHREILSTGVSVEYDQAFRWPAGVENGTLRLLEWMVEEGFGDRLMLGMDAARQGYWTAYGGRPGLAFLLGPFSERMLEVGLDERVQRALFIDNPARAFAFATPSEAARR